MQDCDRNKVSVKLIAYMVHGYVPHSTDMIKETPDGGINPEEIRRDEWLHIKSTWQIMSNVLGFLPDIIDQNRNPVMMPMNKIPIDIPDVKVLSSPNKLSKYPPDVIMEDMFEIRQANTMYFEGNESFPMEEPLEIPSLHKLQFAHIQVLVRQKVTYQGFTTWVGVRNYS
jgi:hypothetical protein